MIRVMAPAKLTRSLAVTGVRADGYHELRSEMVSVSLSDELTFSEGRQGLTLVAEPGTWAELRNGGSMHALPGTHPLGLLSIARPALQPPIRRSLRLRGSCPDGSGMEGLW